MPEYGIFNDEAPNWSEAEAIEAGFPTIQAARKAIAERYSEEDDLTIHQIEEPDEDEEEDYSEFPIKG